MKLIDSGVRHDGLNSATNAVLLAQKLQAGLPKPTDEPPKKDGDK